MAITKDIKTAKSVQEMQNLGFDTEFNIPTTEGLGYDGQTLQRLNANNMATKITVVGTVTYIGIASPGTAQSTAKWQCKKIDTTDGVLITYADGNASFDNVSTDLTSLTYS